MLARIREAAGARQAVPVLGITGTGGSGKSSLTDELVRRFRVDQQDKLRIAVIAVDPTRRKGGGALLGDRIRANSLDGDRIFFRSLATRGAHEVPEHLADVIAVMKAAGFDLVIVETPGIGQGDAAIVPFVDSSLYVMTPEFGAASQLEKIDMLDFADTVAINKFERRGAKDALRDVGRQLVRNREAFGKQPSDMPVFGTSAATFNDDGVTALYQHLRDQLGRPGPAGRRGHAAPRRRTPLLRHPPGRPDRPGALPRRDHRDRPRLPRRTEEYAAAASRVQRLEVVQGELVEAGEPTDGVGGLLEKARKALPHEVADQIQAWPAVVESYSGDEQVVKVRDKELHTKLTRESLSGNKIPRVALPRFTDHGELVRFWRSENLPGFFPFTAGVFPFKRDGEDPARMFAGEGDPFRTNRRFKMLSATTATPPGSRPPSTRSPSTAATPTRAPTSTARSAPPGVSVATLDDMKALYDGFDLVAPSTSVSMTINGPAPTVLAFFLNTVIDQQVDKFRAEAATATRTRPSTPSSRRTPWPTCAAPSRPTSSRRTRARTPACSPPSSRCG